MGLLRRVEVILENEKCERSGVIFILLVLANIQIYRHFITNSFYMKKTFIWCDIFYMEVIEEK
jgi:hypothetical protein